MGATTSIEWTDASWTPIRARNRATGKAGWHCTHVSEACRNCYAERRNKWIGTGLAFKPGHLKDVEIFLDEAMLLAPLRWRKPRMIFVCSMTDLFADFIPDEMIDTVFAVMALCPQHTFQVLTKRPERALSYFGGGPGEGWRERNNRITAAARGMSPALPEGWTAAGVRRLDHVWLGTSAEDQAAWKARRAPLLRLGAHFGATFLSAEPMLGVIDLDFRWDHCDLCGGTGMLARWPKGKCHVCGGKGKVLINGEPQRDGYMRLDWVICGGESGPHARPMHPDWARSLRDQCATAGVPFFFKQWGEYQEFDTGSPVADEVDDESDSADAFLAAAIRPSWITPDGRHIKRRQDLPTDETPCRLIERVGKKAAGRILDGRTHDDLPEVWHG